MRALLLELPHPTIVFELLQLIEALGVLPGYPGQLHPRLNQKSPQVPHEPANPTPPNNCSGWSGTTSQKQARCVALRESCR
jgi:hypothetical protein